MPHVLSDIQAVDLFNFAVDQQGNAASFDCPDLNGEWVPAPYMFMSGSQGLADMVYRENAGTAPTAVYSPLEVRKMTSVTLMMRKRTTMASTSLRR